MREECDPTMNSVTLSVVAPMFNEEKGIGVFCSRLRSTLDGMGLRYEVLLIDDGSSDGSAEVVRNQAWQQCRLITLARNVGHQRAIEAGLNLALGNYVVTLDSDGQHPPELIPSLVSVAGELQVDVVYAVRISRTEEHPLRRHSALIYYRLVRWLTDVPLRNSQADFRLISRRVLQVIEGVRGEKVIRVLLPYLGYPSAVVEFRAGERIAGQSRFGLIRQLRLALDSVFGFSAKPLRLLATMGWILSVAALVWFFLVIATWATSGAVSGWPSVMSAVLLVGGMSLLGLSIVGAYIARIHDMLKNYPRFTVVKEEEATSQALNEQ